MLFQTDLAVFQPKSRETHQTTSGGRTACRYLKKMTVGELAKSMIIRNTNPAQEINISVIVRIMLYFYINGNLTRIMYLLLF
jgi:hypothetical protein